MLSVPMQEPAKLSFANRWVKQYMVDHCRKAGGTKLLYLIKHQGQLRASERIRFRVLIGDSGTTGNEARVKLADRLVIL